MSGGFLVLVGVLRGVLAGTLAFAAAAKVHDRSSATSLTLAIFRRSGTPATRSRSGALLADGVVVAILVCEAIVALLLLIADGPLAVVGALVAVALFGLFILVQRRAMQLQVPCGCFSSSTTLATTRSGLVNMGLLGLAAVLLVAFVVAPGSRVGNDVADWAMLLTAAGTSATIAVRTRLTGRAAETHLSPTPSARMRAGLTARHLPMAVLNGHSHSRRVFMRSLGVTGGSAALGFLASPALAVTGPTGQDPDATPTALSHSTAPVLLDPVSTARLHTDALSDPAFQEGLAFLSDHGAAALADQAMSWQLRWSAPSLDGRVLHLPIQINGFDGLFWSPDLGPSGEPAAAAIHFASKDAFARTGDSVLPDAYESLVIQNPLGGILAARQAEGEGFPLGPASLELGPSECADCHQAAGMCCANAFGATLFCCLAFCLFPPGPGCVGCVGCAGAGIATCGACHLPCPSRCTEDVGPGGGLSS